MKGLLLPPPRFSGYRITEQKGLRFFLPGAEPTSKRRQPSLWLEYRYDDNDPKHLPMQWNGQQWTLQDPDLHTRSTMYYRFLAESPEGEKQPILDHAQQKSVENTRYNVIPKHAKNPESNGVTLLSFPDSVVSPQQLRHFQQQRQQDDLLYSKRTHFNTFNGSIEESNSQFLNRVFNDFGIALDEKRPIIGGDGISSHNYWTTNLFQPSAKIPSEQAFRDMAMSNLRQGAGLCFDGAFVNEGINGVHSLANLYYGHNSPFLKWLQYQGHDKFPNHPLKLGVLPTTRDATTRDDVINNAAWDVRIKPATITPDDPHAPWVVELYDPRLETADGQKKRPKNMRLLSYQDSVQPYQFFVPGKEARKKLEELEKLAQNETSPGQSDEAKLLKRHWNNFELTYSAHHGGSKDWDGQRDVYKVNMRNPAVQDYIKRAFVYWTDKVDRLYTVEVAKALKKAGNTPTLATINRITRKSPVSAHGILPPLNIGQENPVTTASLQKAMENHQNAVEKHPAICAAQTVTDDIRANLPLSSLPGSPLMQVLLSNPRLEYLIKEGEKPIWLKGIQFFFGWLFSIINFVFPNFKPIEWLKPKSVMQRLTDRFETSFAKLSEASRQKLKDPSLAHLFYEDIGKCALLSLMTNVRITPDDLKNIPQHKLELAYTQGIPAYIRNAVPSQTAKLLNQLLVRRANRFDFSYLNPYLEKELAEITPNHVAAARHVLHKRKMGLHWRLDALKDMGNIDENVRNSPKELRSEALWDELHFVKNYMGDVVTAVRKVFPTSVIKAEITDINLLQSPHETHEAAQQEELEMLAYLLEGTIFNGIPNMSLMFSAPSKLVGNATHRPEGEPQMQFSVPEFLHHGLTPTMNTISTEQAYQYQHLTNSHDHSMPLYGLTLHPHMARFNHHFWFGLVNPDGGVFEQILGELEHKTPFLKKGIPQTALNRLRKHVLNNQKSFIKSLPETLRRYEQNPKDYQTTIPRQHLGQFANHVFNYVSPRKLGLSSEKHEQLRTQFKALLLEPTETKAMRGALTNSMHTLAQRPSQLADTLRQQLGYSSRKALPMARKITKQLEKTLPEALWELGQSFPRQHQRWLGYQQIDYVIEWGLKQALDELPENSPLHNRAVREATQQALYNITVGPALEKFQRMAAILVAIPGDPTFYLPDLLGQAGGEDLRNMFLGNRELVRYDWLETNPLIREHFETLATIIRQRREHHVLNNGFLYLPLKPNLNEEGQLEYGGPKTQQLEKKGVLPIMRDNGKDQVICLINTGKPDNAWDTWMGSKKNSRYPEIRSQQPRVKNYKLDLRDLKIPVGTKYKSFNPETGREETFRVNNQYKLVRQGSSGSTKGIDIHITRTLVRQNKTRRR